jgi:hypothetical protein
LPVELYAWLLRQVPAPLDSLTAPVLDVPSPHAMLHVCVSAMPASENVALNWYVVFQARFEPGPGVLIFTVGATFATATVKDELADCPLASLTVTVTV